MEKGEETVRLPVNFHQTFIPERIYLSSLLRLAARGGEGTYKEISAETGIPVGQSSGKVPAILNYCSGMGLIRVEKGTAPGQKRPVLTPFGRSVLLEDANLSEPLSQWLAHLHLCRENGGAEIWHLTFGRSSDVLGMTFSENDLEEYLASICGRKNRSLIGPLMGTYEEPAALKGAGAIVRGEQGLVRTPAPLLRGFQNGYGVLLLSLWEFCFPNAGQVTLSDFESGTYFRRICGWNDEQCTMVLALLQERGVVDIDKQMHPWVLTRRSESSSLWRMLYEDLA
ncbi:DUF4007 family protein [Desulforhabdus sp. TSK]|uniref:DUF4007 family protein n=1 Tax=Desulforhabdus sp. TSK TaxID=2925014 RepID=UPI001FC7BD3C|nr:DUF4007 family protein [Desulforhabdus sp. TSK]GKT09168.1 hypothetical protein DSTSK_24730 [Desulforhabdus sp. TSK]